MAAYSSTIAVTLRSPGECRRRIRSMWARRHLPLRVSWLKVASTPFGRGSGPELASFRAGTLLQPHGLSLGRSGVADPDVGDRPLLLDPLGAPTVPGGNTEPGRPVILQPGRHGGVTK